MQDTSTQKNCCSVSSSESHSDADQRNLDRALNIDPAPASVRAALRDSLRRIPEGIFEMGARKSTFATDLDSPRRKVKVSPFLMAPTAVTNAQFNEFITASGYSTVAELEGWSFVFHLLLAEPSKYPVTPPGLPWWHRIDGATWKSPEGPGSDIRYRMDHPVVHIAWYDALAYCRWAGLCLPSEAQWEFAARGGLARCKFPWGRERMPNGQHAMNTFQGDFPAKNSGDDGWVGTAPVDAFTPNAYGMYNMTGNVWEWVNDRFGPLPASRRIPPLDPAGPTGGYARVQRGGSYMCHESYCDRYFVHSRSSNDPDSSTGNCGFRVSAPIQQPVR